VRKIIGVVVATAFLGGCGSTPPTKIGADTYYSSAANKAGIFGDVGAVAGHLMIEANQFCGGMDKEMQLVSETTASAIPAARLGGASITFKCIDHAGAVNMRPDNGITTITH
jgi:hypothetical protein